MIGHDELNRAFLRLREAGIGGGVIVGFGYSDPEDLRRREMLAPDVRHVGPDGVQRMADAVSLGADPLRFLAGPPVATEFWMPLLDAQAGRNRAT